jgi:hypothetical protein
MIMGRAWFKFNLSYPLTLLGSIFFLILGSLAAAALYGHWRLAARVHATVDHWKVVKKSSSAYSIRGSYHFDFQGKVYQGSSILSPPYHLNRLSAERAISPLKKRVWTVWVDPHHPQVSSLERVFPMKKIIYALVAFGVTLYFWFVETSSRIRNPTN